jgi:hypothetical protein
MLTRAQQAIYRPLVERAWQAQCRVAGSDPADRPSRDAWYRRQLVGLLGIYTTKQASTTDDFDQLVLHFAGLVGDTYWLDRISRSAERRALFQIRRQLRELSEHEGREVDWSYARAIYRQMSGHNAMPEHMHDCPAALLLKIVAALHTHLRRLHSAAA